MLIRITLLVLALLGCQPSGELTAEEPWMRAPLPGKTVVAGYVVLVNDSPVDRILVGTASPDAERVELHTHVTDGAMMRMRRLEQLTVPARSQVALRPGGHHLMVFGLQPEVTQPTRKTVRRTRAVRMPSPCVDLLRESP